ncbi:MAG: rpe [Deltaproteobacteria bacterium]|jgi:ribulose-phosphate 3-epimerase|nr:rpe [Deltaproteobacteria bacterium]MBP1717228.1 rpe [Deltaproteobacteria bacterium]
MTRKIVNPAKKISPSILSADFSRLGEEVRAVEKAGADFIHVDVMDGHFVPNLTIGPSVVKAVKRCTSLPLDVHLMVQRPDDFLSDFAKAGANILTVHVEAVTHLHRTLSEIKKNGMRPGVSLNPSTPVCLIEPILDYADLVLVMSVNPGFGGQELIPEVFPKIKEIRRLITRKGRTIELEVDGGIKVDNIGAVAEAGADIFVSGSGIFGTPDYAKTIAAMKKIISPQGA